MFFLMRQYVLGLLQSNVLIGLIVIQVVQPIIMFRKCWENVHGRHFNCTNRERTNEKAPEKGKKRNEKFK